MEPGDEKPQAVSRRDFLKTAGAAGAFALIASALPELVWADGRGELDPSRLRDLVHPYDVAVGPDGSLYVANAGRYGVAKLSPAGAVSRVGGGPGAGPGKLNFPMGVAVSPGGNVLVADTNNGRVQLFDPNGNLLRSFGRLGYLDGEFHRPKSVCFYKTGVLVADTRNHRVQFIDLESERLVTREPITRAIYGGLGDGPADLKLPRYVAANGDGDVYVADAGHAVVKIYRWDGTLKGTLGAGVFSEPAGIACEGTGRVFVADAGSAQVFIFGEKGTHLGRVAGLPPLVRPRGIAVADGILYVADPEAGRVAFARVSRI